MPKQKWSAAALRDRSHLATGTTAPSRAQRRWPILDVHDVKQQSVGRSRITHVQCTCMTFLKASILPRTRALVRASVRTSRVRRLRIVEPIAREPARRRACSGIGTHGHRYDYLELDAGHCGSLLPVGGGSGPPPVSPIVSDSVRIAVDVPDNPIPRAQSSARSVA
jgi:hypothetical protein